MKVDDIQFRANKITLVFKPESTTEVKRIKAIAILYGMYNPMREQMQEGNNILDYIDDYRFNRTNFEDTIEKISSQLN